MGARRARRHGAGTQIEVSKYPALHPARQLPLLGNEGVGLTGGAQRPAQALDVGEGPGQTRREAPALLHQGVRPARQPGGLGERGLHVRAEQGDPVADLDQGDGRAKGAAEIPDLAAQGGDARRLPARAQSAVADLEKGAEPLRVRAPPELGSASAPPAFRSFALAPTLQRGSNSRRSGVARPEAPPDRQSPPIMPVAARRRSHAGPRGHRHPEQGADEAEGQIS